MRLSYFNCLGMLALYTAAMSAQQPGWVQQTPSTSPTARAFPGSAIAYDTARRQVVLFGGFDGSPSGLSDTWVWDGATWIDKTPPNPANRPLPRVYTAAMAYDEAHRQVILFGGLSASGAYLSDTWAWDGATWQLKNPLNRPPGRDAHAMAYDAVRGQVVLFGGNNSDLGGALADTWVWDGTNWTNKTPSNSANSPPKQVWHTMAYDAARDRIVLFSGAGSSPNFSDTWVWDGSTWAKKTPPNPANSPSLRIWESMAYDKARGQVILFGGYDLGGTLFDDTWAWDGTIWTNKTPSNSANSPPALLNSAMAFDAGRDQIVVFGGSINSVGFTNGTWLWPGVPSPPPCGDERDVIVQQYPDHGVLFTPACSDLRQTITQDEQPAPHFSFASLQSPDTSWAILRGSLLGGLETIRYKYGIDLVINSGYRTPFHNCCQITPRGTPNSRHIYGDAADIATNSVNWHSIQSYGKSAGACVEPAQKSGLGHVHVDWRGICPTGW